ncbi:MAG: UDP-glucose 4-epimerase GalE [Acidobacteriia bacterium]|nr:UDP-glucose 4-epimerase GalE [Terriglobia bacterium]
MNILVTGAAGYVGSVCASELVNARHSVVAFDNFSAGHRAAIVKRVKLIEGDIADAATVKRVCRKFRIEAVMHFAAKALVDESMRNPGLFYRNNVSGTITLLDVLVECGIQKLVFSSSAAVYGEPKEVPITEEHPLTPINPYGETKLVIERALAWYQHAHGLRWVALRYFNAAGAVGALGEDHRPETHLVPRLLDAALNSDRTFHIYGDDYPTPDGTCVRDYVHVRDIARAHILALRALPRIRGAVFNVGHGEGFSVREVVRGVEEVTRRTLRVEVSPRRAGDPAVLVASPAKISRDLGWKPRHSDLRGIIRSAWTWKTKHPDGYHRTRSAR